MKRLKIFLISITLLGGVFSFAIPARANWRMESGVFTLTKDRVIEGDLFFSGERLEIDGVIRGDLLLFGEEVIINGRIDGSILGAVSGKLRNNGVVGGSLRGIINEVYLNRGGVIKGNISAFAIRLITASDSLIEKGILGRFSEVELKGRVNGPVSFNSVISTKLSGEINGDVRSGGARIEWVSPLTVTGKVIDSTGYDNNPAKLEGIKLDGGYQRQKPIKGQMGFLKAVTIFSFIWFLGSLLTSVIFYRLFPRTAWKVTEPSVVYFRRSLLMGLIGLIGLPVIIIILTITVVGLPLAVLLGLFYLIILLFARIPVNLWFGRLLFRSRLNPVLMTVLGGLFLALLNFLPIIGLLINPLLLVLGMGMIIGNIRFQVNQHLNNKINL
jgi:cytoskeletal protein CcmA (bactofilin family)